MVTLHHFPLGIKRSDCDSEEQYHNLVEHYDELYNEAEDIAMERYYEEKYNS